MKPYEEAVDIWLSFYELLPDGVYSDEGAKSEAKKYATICVDRMLAFISGFPEDIMLHIKPYWQSVKTEIEKL